MGMVKHGAGKVVGTEETPPPEAKPERNEDDETEVMEPSLDDEDSEETEPSNT